MSGRVFEAKKLTKRYKEKEALSGVDISLEGGKIYGFVGLNGAGKTTLMRTMAGLAFPTSGSIELFGETGGRSLGAARRRAGFLIEQPVFHEAMTARQNLKMVQTYRGKRSRDEIEELLSTVGLINDKDIHRHVRNYSTGMKQRYGIAAALVGSPELLVLDEPINGLDPAGVREIRMLLKEINGKSGTTILISSHILPELYQLATDYIFIHQGRIAEAITSAELDRRCSQRIVMQVSDYDKAAEIIGGCLAADEFTVVRDEYIEITSSELLPQFISEKLGVSGVFVHKLEQKGKSLEEYFLNLTQRGDGNA